MSKKTGPQHGPYPHDNGAALLSRRRLLLGMGMMSGTLALGGAKIARAADCPAPEAALAQDERWQKQPFYGQHQSGVLTPQQAAMMLVAFDVLATDKAALTRLFKLLTERLAFLTSGGHAPSVNAKLPRWTLGLWGRKFTRIT